MNTFHELSKAATTLSSDIHRRQEATNSRLAEACRRFREVEEQAPERILPVVSRGPPFRQPKTFSSGLFLRHTAPEEVNAFRAQAQPKPDFGSLEQFRGCLMNPPDKFTISRPEYFLDCWLEEQEERQRKMQYKRGTQTKRRREEKIFVPELAVERTNEHGEVVKVVLVKSTVMDAHSRTPSLEEYALPKDLADLPAVPQRRPAVAAAAVPTHGLPAATKAVPTNGLPKPHSHSRHSSSSSSEGLPKPKRRRVPPRFVPPTTLPSRRPSEVTIIPEPVAPAQRSPIHDQIISGPGIRGLTPSQPVPEEESVVPASSSRRKSPLAFHGQITGGLGKAGLKKVKQEPRKKDYRPAFIRAIENHDVRKAGLKKVPQVPKVRDYRPAWIKEIESHKGLQKVQQEAQQPARRQFAEETNPLWAKLKIMRKTMGIDEVKAPQTRVRASSGWSDTSDF